MIDYKLLQIAPMIGALTLVMISPPLWAKEETKTPVGTTPLTKAIRLEKFKEAKKHITPELVNKMDQSQYHPLTYATYTRNAAIKAFLRFGSSSPKMSSRR